MTGAPRWASLLLCLMQSTSGRPLLAPPQNVTLLSWDFSVYLTWLPGPGNPQNMTYFVAYQSSATPKQWRRVKMCAGTKELQCSLMCLEKQDLCNKFKGRVRAVSPRARSPWVESKSMDYFFEVEPAPPVLVFTRTDEILSVNATYQLPHCMPQPDLSYEVYFWKEGTGNEDLSGHRHPGATFQPSGPECLHVLILCPQKEQTRRVRLTPRVRAPATVQAGSEDSAEEEEADEESSDDGVSFQPYTEPPPFLGQEHQSPGQAEAGGPWTPLVQVEGSSACDSSDRSWASTAGSSTWDEAGSSGYLAKKRPGRGPGGKEFQKPLPPPEFSEDSSSLEEPPEDSPSSWVSWGLPSPGLILVPREPPVSLQTLTFCWDSSPEEEEEGGGESESEDSSDGSCGAKSLQRIEARGRTLGHYLAR
ncbi:interferon lambda receptor 1 isoform X3 [Lagenorhynchus albirostris]|uniref:interferon lambda receptor 1 isoform X3 n=1 Tax=Lagenorhynchus albirostris TaxID=27610 RepID=UPI0028EB2711|nr:interferon lambda receptor 1 isoform X3 [Lagenorhynchus albirostris]